MQATLHARQPAPALACAGVRLRRCVRANAFGNALGSSVAGMATQGSQQEAKLPGLDFSLANGGSGNGGVGFKTSGRSGLGVRFSEDSVFDWVDNVDAGIKSAAANLPATELVAGLSFLGSVNRMLAAQTGYADAEYGSGTGWQLAQMGGPGRPPQIVRRQGGEAGAQAISDPWGLIGPGLTGGYDDVKGVLDRHALKTQIDEIRNRLGAGGRTVPSIGTAIGGGDGRIVPNYSPETLERFKIIENFEQLRRQGIVELDANWNVKSVASGRQMLIDPRDIRFTQKTASYFSSDGINNLDTTGIAARTAPESLPPLTVVVMADGKLTSIDNRRLTAGYLYDASKMSVIIRGSSDPLPVDVIAQDRFTWKQQHAQTWGEAVLMRVWDQGGAFKAAFPSGSPVVPLIKNAPNNPLYEPYRHLPPQQRR